MLIKNVTLPAVDVLRANGVDNVEDALSALENLKATGATRARTPQDRAAESYSAADFTGFETDAGASANAAVAVMQTQIPSNITEATNGVVQIPRGAPVSKTSIKLDKPGTAPTMGVALKGAGITSTILDMRGAAAGTNGVETIAGAGGAIYPKVQDMGVFYAPGAGFRLNTATRGIYESLQSAAANADGFYFGNVFMSHMRQMHALSGKSHGINFANGTVFPGTTGVFTKTSVFTHTNWARKNAGFGIGYADIYYSHSSANGSDENGQDGYRYSGIVKGFASTADGAESNQNAGFAVRPDGTREKINCLSFRNIGAYGNNRANNGSPNLLVVQPTNGAEAWVSLEGSYSMPAGAGNSTKDVLVIGDGAHLYLKGDCDLPNGFESRNGGYIHFEQVPIIVSKTVPLSTGTAIAKLQSTQGKDGRYAGKILVNCRSTHPSEDGTNLSVYELMVQKSDSGAPAVKVIAKSGYADLTPGSGAVAWPVFDWSLNTATNMLVATPVANVGGVTFHFEIMASGGIWAKPA